MQAVNRTLMTHLLAGREVCHPCTIKSIKIERSLSFIGKIPIFM
jgi:hypothetical protein